MPILTELLETHFIVKLERVCSLFLRGVVNIRMDYRGEVEEVRDFLAY